MIISELRTTSRLSLQPIVSCDGGGGALGHPRIYINLERGKVHACIYCQQKFMLKKANDDKDETQQKA